MNLCKYLATFGVLHVLVLPVRADEITDRIRVGSTQEEVISIMGGKPYDTDCSSILGVKSCKLFWKRAAFDKVSFVVSFYEIMLVAERVVSTSVQTKKGDYK